jgi:hypothetical protein
MLLGFTASDAIALTSAALLAVGSYFAWKAYTLSAQEHREARHDAQLEPQRQRLDDVYRELKYLAAAAATEMNLSHPNFGVITGHQRRLQIALAFVSRPMPATKSVAELSALSVLTPPHIDAAAQEIVEAMETVGSRD